MKDSSDEKRTRFSFIADDVLEIALANLKGTPFNRHQGRAPGQGFAQDPNQLEVSRQRQIIFAEAVFALEEFAAKHGYIPRMPRFDVVTSDADERPADPRRPERLRELEAIDRALECAGGVA